MKNGGLRDVEASLDTVTQTSSSPGYTPSSAPSASLPLLSSSSWDRSPPESGLPPAAPPPLLPRLLSALFYAVCATFIVMVNKIVLTTYQFPSFLVLGLGQMLITLVLLPILAAFGVVHLPIPHRKIFRMVFPLPLLFLGNIIFSLGGTKKLSIPMYVVLRRFGNLFIMCAEYTILGTVASMFVQGTIYLMIFGAFIAAVDDLAFDAEGYGFIFITNICAALSGVFTKEKLNKNTLGTYGLMFYNSLFMVLPLTCIAYVTGDIAKAMTFEQWVNPVFLLLFLLACVMGFLVNFATMLSTKYNSALTTSIVGVLKNMVVVYSGMFIGGDYVFSIYNFIGINISMVGGLMYSYATFIAKSTPKPTPSPNSAAGPVMKV